MALGYSRTEGRGQWAKGRRQKEKQTSLPLMNADDADQGNKREISVDQRLSAA
jgi:hypothetical protein